MEPIKLLIVDDRDIIRDSLKLYFSKIPEITVKGEAEDGETALELIKKHDYDVILMDLLMPNLNGIEATRNIIKLKPNIKILANSFSSNPYNIKQLIEAGAYGFITKDESRNVYIEAVKTVHNGEIFLSDGISNEIYNKVLDYLK